MNKKINNLKIIRDIPEFETAYDEEKDTFNHKAYADVLEKIIQNNPAPLIIGLLGPWGTGKTTILNLFKKSVKDSYNIIYFNAWKYANDSFRRQFLVECAKNLIDNQEKSKQYVQELNNKFIKDLNKKIYTIKDLFKSLKYLKINIITLLTIGIVILILGVFIVGTYGAIHGKTAALIGSSVGLLPIGYLLKLLIDKLLPNLFNIDIGSPIINPEDFEEEFNKLINKTNKDIIFIIDDIDRCSHSMIMDVLDASKTFFTSPKKIHEKQCYFIIALDDEAVTSILQQERATKYNNEEVLKFFDVTVRLNALDISDLNEFSRAIAKESNISEDVIHIAIYGGFDTPRKIKHFLNSFKSIFSIIEMRNKEKIFNLQPSEIESLVAKVLVLQIKFPLSFNKLLKDYNKLNEWTELAKNKFENPDKIEESQEPENDNQEPENDIELLKFLWATQDIEISDLEQFLHFKLPTYSSNINNYQELKDAILNNEPSKINELLKSNKEIKNKKAIIELSRDFLDKQLPSDIKLLKILKSTITIYDSSFFDNNEKKNLSFIIKHLLRYKKILSFDPDILFHLVEQSKKSKDNKNILYDYGINDLSRKPNAIYSGKFINLLYKERNIDENHDLSNRVNESLNKIMEKDSQWGLDILQNINNKISSNKKWEDLQFKIPSPSIITEKLLPLIDEKETMVDFYNRIIEISFKFWDAIYLPILTDKSIQILKHWNNKNTTELNSSLKFILNIIHNIPVGFSEDKSTDLLNQIWTLYHNASEKESILEAYCIVNYSLPNQQQNYEVIKNQSFSFDRDNFKKIVKFIQGYDGEYWEQLNDLIISNVLEKTESNPNETNLQKFDYIYLNKKCKIADTNIENILMKVFQSNEQIIELWKNECLKLAEDKELAKWIIENLRDLINKNSINKEKLLVIYIEIIGQIKSKEESTKLFNFIFDLCKNANSELVQLGLNKLDIAKDLRSDLFNIKINSEVVEICKKDNNTINQHQAQLTKYISYQNIWAPDTNNQFTKSLISLISSGNKQFLDLAKQFIQLVKFIKGKPETLKSLKSSIDFIENESQKNEFQKLIQGKVK